VFALSTEDRRSGSPSRRYYFAVPPNSASRTFSLGSARPAFIKTFLNGKLVSNIVIDSSQVATDTIDYVATDSAGLTSTSTRIVLIEALAIPSVVPMNNASTTATTTAQ
jgi:hypothetical protein